MHTISTKKKLLAVYRGVIPTRSIDRRKDIKGRVVCKDCKLLLWCSNEKNSIILAVRVGVSSSDGNWNVVEQEASVVKCKNELDSSFSSYREVFLQ